MFVDVGDGLFAELFHLVDGGEGIVEAGARLLERVAAREAGVHQLARPDAVVERLPKLLALIGLQPLDTRLAALAAFDHALHRFEPVVVVAVDTAVADADGFFDLGAQGHFDRGRAPGDGQRRAGHKGKAHLLRNIVHLLTPVPIPREVLVVKDGCRFARGAKDGNDLFEEFVARVLVLALLVAAIAAVLGD